MKQYSAKLKKCLGRLLPAALSVAFAAGFQACDLVNDGTDCVDSYNLVKFVYTHNMKYTCALDNEVEHFTIYLFDEDSGELKYSYDVDHIVLNDENELSLNVEPGNYEILVWAGKHQNDYVLAQGQETKASVIDAVDCYMKREVKSDGSSHIEKEIENLYHGRLSVSLPWASPSKPNRITIPLMKNTNTIRVVLQELSGDGVESNDYVVEVSDPNGWMNADNSLHQDDMLTYHPFYTQSGSVDINTNPNDAPTNTRTAPEWSRDTRAALGASLWEFRTGRLMTDNETALTVKNAKTGETVLSISAKDYALLVKGFHNRELGDQEYLDRQDEYNMTFFLNNGKWLSSVIIINNWRIVRNDAVLE